MIIIEKGFRKHRKSFFYMKRREEGVNFGKHLNPLEKYGIILLKR